MRTTVLVLLLLASPLLAQQRGTNWKATGTHGDIVEAVLGHSLNKGAAAVLEVEGDEVRLVRTLKAP